MKDALYFARRGRGAFVEADGTTRKLGASRLQEPAEVRVGISRLNPDEGLGKCLAASGLAPRAVQMGASAKHMALARGEIDAVLNLSPAEMEWDTCAPEVVLTEAGCTVTDGDGRPFRYNQKDLHRRRGSVASNGKCHSLMLRVMAPCLPEPAPLIDSSPRQPALTSRGRARPLEHAEQQHEAGHQHGDAGGEHDQQQALRARAGGGVGERDVRDERYGYCASAQPSRMSTVCAAAAARATRKRRR